MLPFLIILLLYYHKPGTTDTTLGAFKEINPKVLNYFFCRSVEEHTAIRYAEHTRSRLVTESKQSWASLVLGWVTACKHLLYCILILFRGYTGTRVCVLLSTRDVFSFTDNVLA